MNKIAIVILNYNGEAMLRRYLPSVVKNSGSADIIVADNASTDGSLVLLRAEFPSVGIIENDHNYGFAEGYNRALAKVEAEYYVLLNSDVEVTEGWLEPLLSFMKSKADCAACQPKLRSASSRDMFEYAGACGGLIDRYGYPYCRGRIFGTIERDDGQYDDPTEVFWASGAALFIRSADYKAAGGLDARFFAHNEEIDLCWRLKIMGRKVYCVPSSVVYHVGGGTLPKNNPAKTYLNFRNNLTMLYKNLPDSEFRQVMRVRRVLDMVAALQALLTGHYEEYVAIRHGRRDFKAWRNLFANDRRQWGSKSSPALTGRYGGSILWQYYVKGQKSIRGFQDPSSKP